MRSLWSLDSMHKSNPLLFYVFLIFTALTLLLSSKIENNISANFSLYFSAKGLIPLDALASIRHRQFSSRATLRAKATVKFQFSFTFAKAPLLIAQLEQKVQPVKIFDLARKVWIQAFSGDTI